MVEGGVSAAWHGGSNPTYACFMIAFIAVSWASEPSPAGVFFALLVDIAETHLCLSTVAPCSAT